MKIAIVGSGIAGLAAGEELHKSGHEITLFEANDYVGGHVKTIKVPLEGENTPPLIVDLGVFMHDPISLHPTMHARVEKLGIKTHPFDFSFAMFHREHKIRYQSTINPHGTTIHSIVKLLKAAWIDAQNRYPFSNTKFLLALDAFYKQMPTILSERRYEEMSIGEYLYENPLSKALIQSWLHPNLMCWWGVPERLAKSCSLRVIIDSLYKTPGYDQYIFTEGWERLTDAIAQPFSQNIRLNSAVKEIRRTEEGTTITAKGKTENYDAILMAIPPNRCLEVLKDLSPEEKQILKEFTTTTTKVYLHRDERWAPPIEERGIINLINNEQGSYTSLWSGGLDTRKPPLFVTWGEQLHDTINPSTIITTANWNRTLPTTNYAKASRHIETIQGNKRIWYCGAHVHALSKENPPSLWHENAFISGQKAAQNLMKTLHN